MELRWHRGRDGKAEHRHGWAEHDGYPRHAHSKNGVLTIHPRDPHPHFAWGPPFPGEEPCLTRSR